MKVLRCSYTVLNAWSRGDYEGALNSLFRLKEKDTPQIRAGREFDDQWTEEVKKTKCQPKVFGGEKLKDPKVQLFLQAQITDWLLLTGKIDLYDSGEITDWKTGITDAQSIITGYQCPTYAILAFYNNLPAEKVNIHHWNQYTQQPTYAFAWVNKKMIERTANWIETNASEIYDYIDKNNLWKLDRRK